MRVLFSLVLAAAVIVGGYFLYTSPRIQELTRPSPEQSGDPLKFLEEPLPSRRPEEPRRFGQRSNRPSVSQQPPASETPPAPALPNDEVASVLLGILRARGLADGISLGVSDEVLAVSGDVDSTEQRNRIIETLDKGRGPRRLDAENLKVRP